MQIPVDVTNVSSLIMTEDSQALSLTADSQVPCYWLDIPVSTTITSVALKQALNSMAQMGCRSRQRHTLLPKEDRLPADMETPEGRGDHTFQRRPNCQYLALCLA